MNPIRILLAFAVAGIFVSATPSFADDIIRLGLPLKCSFGTDCFVQNFVDHDAGSGARDFQCAKRTYDTHNGTDFRLADDVSRKRGVEVLSLAAGRIARVRDGMDDVSIRVGGRDAVKGKECGNAIVIEHENGWSTQYCHLAKGSVRVKPGDNVDGGQPIGLVGLSGDTEFSHLHVSVRRANKIVDPYAYGAPPESCGGGTSLWKPEIASSVEYKNGEVINFGFASSPPTMQSIETGEIRSQLANSQTPLIAYIRAIGLKAGDIQSLVVRSPTGETIVDYTSPTIESDRAQQFISAGRRAPNGGWPKGEYAAHYTLKRANSAVLTKKFNVTVAE